jgi:hypothetical protein
VSQVTFTNPANGATYVWPVNPTWDAITQPATKAITIERTSNTANVGAMKQQGDTGPYIQHWEPLIFHEAHELALWEWWALSLKQTIYMTDWNDETYEVQIVTLGRQWIGAAGGPGDTKARCGYAKYVIEFEVYRFVSGLMATAGVEP